MVLIYTSRGKYKMDISDFCLRLGFQYVLPFTECKVPLRQKKEDILA